MVYGGYIRIICPCCLLTTSRNGALEGVGTVCSDGLKSFRAVSAAVGFRD